MQPRINNSKGILQLWINWIIGSGLITLLMIVSLWIRPLYLPFVAYGLQFLVFLLIKHNRGKQLPSCYLFPFMASRVLFWSGTVMLVINLLYSRWLIDIIFDPSSVNPEIPFITSLIIWPITAIIALWVNTHRTSFSFCRDCRLRAGTPAERGFLGKIYTREGQYQVQVTMIIAIGVSVLSWAYYLISYVNESLSLPDRFVFFWLESLLWVAATIYFAMRYLGIWGYYCQDVEGGATRHGRSTCLRYIIISGDQICVRRPQTGADLLIPGSHFYDTPVSVYDSWQANISLAEAERVFATRSDIDNADVRFFYSNTRGNADCNIFHFFAFLSEDEREAFSARRDDCEWINFREVAAMINEKKLNPLMSAEITRLYVTVMAWKTYDRQGRRRYKIKHYRPTFHISDIQNWDVNYNDPTWLYIADNNQDVPFYNLRRLWRKYVNGVGNYIDELTPTDTEE